MKFFIKSNFKIADGYSFVLFAVENLEPWGPRAKLANELSNRLVERPVTTELAVIPPRKKFSNSKGKFCQPSGHNAPEYYL